MVSDSLALTLHHSYTHEAYFYVFEGVLMLANSVMLNIMHPGRLLPQDSRIYLGLDGVTELRGPGWRDPRKWYWQLCDPFDFAGCCKRDPQFDFWNHPQADEGADEGGRNVEAAEVKREVGVAAAESNAAESQRSFWSRALGPVGSSSRRNG